MTYQPTAISDDLSTLPQLPSWVTSGRAETLETVAFRSGVALTVLDALVSEPRYGLPLKLLGNRLALTAATSTSKLEGRLAPEEDIRDAYHLTPPGEARGPDGDLLAFWREAVRLRLNGREWQAGLGSLIGHNAETDVHTWLNAGFARARTHGPLAGCALVMRCVLEADDRAERVACLLSDVVLARTLNWQSLLPITAQYLTKAMLRDLVAEGQGDELKIQQRLLESIEETIRLARDLSSKAAALHVIAPKLRAKGSEAAVALILSEDAVAPASMLSPMIQGTTIPMTDRAARRFCDRLVRGARADRAADVPAVWDRSMNVAAKRNSASKQQVSTGEGLFDRELADLPQELRWREWMGRIEAVLFASASPVGREDLARVIGQGASVEMLIDDIQTELVGRPYELAEISDGWMFRTRTQFAEAIKAAADLGDQSLAFTEMEMGVLCTIAYHQPIDRAGLKDIFGKEVSRDLLARLRFKDLIASGPRSPRPGAPHTFVTTETFLVTFDLQNLRDLPELVLHREES